MSHSPGSLQRFSSRSRRLSYVFLKDRLAEAKRDRRIAGYFRSSIFELVDEEIEGIDSIEIVCNSDLDPRDITASRLARETALKKKWNEGFDENDSLMYRKRYQWLYELLKGGKVKVQVVSANDAPFLHGKAGVIESRDGAKTFIGSLNETREGWQEHYEIVWEDRSAEGVGTICSDHCLIPWTMSGSRMSRTWRGISRSSPTRSSGRTLSIYGTGRL
jgi:hypothetical protein